MERVYLDCTGMPNSIPLRSEIPNSIYVDASDLQRVLSNFLECLSNAVLEGLQANRHEPLVSQAASQALPEPNQQSKVCVWRSIEDEYYDTTCKHSVYFEDGSLEGKPDYKYCPYCGKEILNEKKQLCEK